ncbi:MAG TPA: NifU family protein [Candidatus Bipolaricaulota bacterium]|nr:NifU family protein [Candidatus Bipolaricaulota bacterium]
MEFKEQVEQVINEIRPHLQADGGDIELVEADASNGQVKVRLAGHCAHCPMATLTLQKLVEKNLKTKIKEVTEVINVTV